MTATFGFFVVLCVLWGRFVVVCSAIQKLGHPSDCPPLFLRRSGYYHLIFFALQGGVLVTGLLSDFPGWWTIPVFLFMLLLIRFLGQNAAFSKYRKIQREMLSDAAEGFMPCSVDQLERIRERASISNSVLKAELAKQIRMDALLKR